jgi:Tol biopolymer transport system component
VKVLDFGLAKPATGEGSTADLTQSPTITVGGTHQGAILGTAAYMSPEQARGRAVDKRTDIWAFGCVLFEMLTGSVAFAGDTVSDTIAKILEREPDWRALPATTSANIRHLLQRCLQKDSKHRLRDIGDARMDIDDALAASARSHTAQSGGTRQRWIWGLVGASLALGLGVGWVVTRLPRSAASMSTLTLTLDAPAGTEFVDDNGFAISPDDRLVAFAARSSAGTRLWVRSLSSSTARELPGTDDAVFPFWSPDSRSLGFFAAGKLKRIDLAGGAPTVICNVGAGRGATWNDEGLILFNSVNDGPLLRVSATGGMPEAFTVLDRSQGENSHRWPAFLPGGRSFLYYVRNDTPEQSGLYIGTLDKPKDKVRLVTTNSNGIYVPRGGRQSGHLFWIRNGALVAQAFEAATGRVSGDIVRVADNVAVGGASALIAASVSTDGTIVYHPSAIRTYQLTWYGRDGKSLNAVGPPDAYVGPRISPDGRRVAVRLRGDIWQMELARGILTRVTFQGRNIADPFWSPDNQRIALSMSANASGNPTLFAKSASGTGSEEQLLDSRDTLAAQDWSPDGSAMLYSMQSNDLTSQALDLWILPLTGDKKPIPFVTTPFVEGRGQFSPDGKWVAYTSNESGRNEVYVQSFPVSGAKWQISNGGGDWVRWRRDGKELFYVAPNRELRSVTIAGAPASPEFETSKVLFVLPVTLTQQGGQQVPYSYDVMPDGQRILALVPTAAERPPLTVIVNWQAESSANTN